MRFSTKVSDSCLTILCSSETDFAVKPLVQLAKLRAFFRFVAVQIDLAGLCRRFPCHGLIDMTSRTQASVHDPQQCQGLFLQDIQLGPLSRPGTQAFATPRSFFPEGDVHS